MKKQILSLLLVIFGGFFFAGFGGIVSAQGEEELLYTDLVENKCKAILKLVNEFEVKKSKNDFDYSRIEYEKEAYQKELLAYISLEKAVACVEESKICKKESFPKINPNKGCLNDNQEIFEKPDKDLDRLKYSAQKFENSAKLFGDAENLYFGSKHLSLETGKEVDEKGNIVGGKGGLDEIMTKNIIAEAGGGFIHSTQETLKTIFTGSLIKKVNRVLGTFGILYLFILGTKFIMARGESERLSNLKGQFAWIILGLAIISLAEFIGYDVFDPSGGKDVLEGSSAQNFRYKAMEIVRFFEYFAGGLMIINALISGYGLITNGEEDEAISKEKQFIKSFFMGTAFILLAEVIVRILSFQDGVSGSAQIAVKEVAGLVNFSLSFVGILAVSMLIMAGLYYVISFGDEDQMGRAKKMIIGSLIGVIVAFSAYTIVRFLIV